MVTIRSSSGRKEESTLSSVVLPVPVPPETMMFSFAFTQAFSSSAISGVSVPNSMRFRTVSGTLLNFRMVSEDPPTASGGMTALTRDPSSRRASTSGEDSSMRRPTLETIRSITLRRWSSELKRDSVSVSLPCRST